jgi:4-hydroxy-3-methylbut-2-enyl diphosphate reductase
MFEQFVKKVREIFPSAHIFHSICSSTRRRQDELISLLETQNCDAVVIIGSQTSSNTNKLVSMVRQAQKMCFFTENVSQLANCDLGDNKKVILTAGASTPPWEIDAVERYLLSL